MFLFDNTHIDSLAIHGVGNKSLEDGVTISSGLIKLNDSLNELLLTFFLNPFKESGFFTFSDSNELENNQLYETIAAIFEDPGTLYDKSTKIANQLYNCSIHPKIKWGELYVVYFQDCLLDDNAVDAIGIFKTEHRDIFINLQPSEDNYTVQPAEGIPLGKLEKGCLIFNTMPEQGYLISLTDNLRKSSDAQYWKDDFLKITPRNDNYFQTNNVIQLCKGFASEVLPSEFNVSKVDMADLLNKSASFLSENDNFRMDDFAKEVIKQPEVIESFNKYKNNFESEHDIQINDEFELSPAALKNQKNAFKSVIKLDKNFHIYVHGSRQNIIKGFDDQTGLNFYQLFYQEEK